MKKSNIPRVIIIALAIISFGLVSCLDDTPTRIDCIPFSSQNELRWFAGVPGDTLSFTNQNNGRKSFEITDKYLIHTTSYLFQPWCNCHDVWGLLLVDGTDSIGVFGQHLYNQYEEFRLNNLNIKIDGKLTAFNTSHRSVLSTHVVGGVEMRNVVRFQRNHTDSLQFRTILIAPEIGIVQMERVNGEIWTNSQLERTLRFDLESFEYSERTCE